MKTGNFRVSLEKLGKMKKTIIPSIIANSQKELNERIKKVNSKIYQLDIMDGKFVKSKSLWFDFKLPKGKKYEAHLMIENPRFWIEKNWKKAASIIFHAESFGNAEGIIKLIRSKKKKVGIALNPGTDLKRIKNQLKKIDLVLVMTVSPGKYGANFIPKALDKLKQIRKFKPNMEIEVDGGINEKTIKMASNFGANRFVVGSYLQKNTDPKKAFDKLKDVIKT